MILGREDLKILLKDRELVIEPFAQDSIGCSSIDLRLGPILLKYSPQVIDLCNSIPSYEKILLTKEGYLLKSGEFVLGMTREYLEISKSYQGFIETKGNIARAGVQIHNADGHIDPGFSGNVTLEIKNMNNNGVDILLYPDIYICQLFIFKLQNPIVNGYNGRYSKNAMPTHFLP